MNERDVKTKARDFADWVLNEFCSSSLKISKKCLEKVDGRKEREHSAVRKGSHVYVAHEDDSVLYVGETAECVRTRFMGDGSGAHRRTDWYCRMTDVRFLKLPSESDHHRKLMEAALIFALRPSEQPDRNPS